MKATGIVRRIDELGRIVIPSELRRTLRIKEGDPMEFFTGDGGVVVKPYQVTEELLSSGKLEKVIKAVKDSCVIDGIDVGVTITSTSSVLVGNGTFKLPKSSVPALTEQFYKQMVSTDTVHRTNEPVWIGDNTTIKYVKSIMSEDRDLVGSVVFAISKAVSMEQEDIIVTNLILATNMITVMLEG